MLFRRLLTAALGVAVVLTTSSALAAAEPASDNVVAQGKAECEPPPANAGTERRSSLRDNPDLRFMIENAGVSHWFDAIVFELDSGLSDEIINHINSNPPAYPGGAPLPTYAPPLPAPRQAEAGRAPASDDKWKCHKASALYFGYSLLGSGACLIVGAVTTPLGGFLCGWIAWGGEQHIDWNSNCPARDGQGVSTMRPVAAPAAWRDQPAAMSASGSVS